MRTQNIFVFKQIKNGKIQELVDSVMRKCFVIEYLKTSSQIKLSFIS